MCRLLVGGLEAVALVRVLVSLVDGDVPRSSSDAAEALRRMSTAFGHQGLGTHAGDGEVLDDLALEDAAEWGRHGTEPA